jgi:hypothetical protein
MKRTGLSAFAVLTGFVLCVFFAFDAAADDKTCKLKADEGDVHVHVWDEDSEEDRQEKIFEGWIKKNDEKVIRSTTGFIVFSYRLASDERSYGDNHKRCKNGNTIQVP